MLDVGAGEPGWGGNGASGAGRSGTSMAAAGPERTEGPGGGPPSRPPRCEHRLPGSPRNLRPPRDRIAAFTQAAEDRKPVRIRRGPATVTRPGAATRAGPGVRH
ncbi:hypothetical protein Srut_14960 [Streptomyces rutgersensis]|nr:hypothetical protein Srut_14960 [Streptomyces rutgersensis]